MDTPRWAIVPTNWLKIFVLSYLVGTQDKFSHMFPLNLGFGARNTGPQRERTRGEFLDDPPIWSHGIPEGSLPKDSHWDLQLPPFGVKKATLTSKLPRLP